MTTKTTTVRRWTLATLLLALLTLLTLMMNAAAQGGIGNAALPPAPGDRPLVAFEGDRQAGRQLAGGNGGAPCASCHGARGEGNAAAGYPRIAGQPAYYLFKQLTSYADGSRPNEIMTPIAKGLNDAQRRDLAAYFATLEAPAPHTATRAVSNERGRTLAVRGDNRQRLPACANCHGPNGTGLAPDAPYLAGQNAQYLEVQLQSWQQDKRRNDPNDVMAEVARALSPEETRAVAQYFAALQPPTR